mgnify:CR=1 FL=1
MLFSILFRKYPLFRTAIYAVLVVVSVFLISFFTTKTRKIPVIHALNPAIGVGGDTVSILGENFGQERGTSFVEIGTNRITASGYVFWSDSEIKIVLPQNVQDGFLSVSTQSGKSVPLFFANAAGIPVPSKSVSRAVLPALFAVSPTSAAVGSVVVLSGERFGSVRGNSLVVFREDGTENECFALESESDYESWSDGEIRVRVPDGANSGTVFVRTESGESIAQKFSVLHPYGKKTFLSSQTYSIQLEENIEEISASSGNITLRVPRPDISSSQPAVLLNESTPEPIIADFKNTIVYTVSLSGKSGKKVDFLQNFVVTRREVKTEIEKQKVRAFSAKEKARPLYKKYTSPDALVLSDNTAIVSLSQEITSTTKNPYEQARLLYEYMISSFSILTSPKSTGESALELLSKKSGDAYDFAVIYASLLRAAGIPSVPVSGILIDSSLKAQNHWWTEFYLEGIGWIPADPALGASLPYTPFREIENARTFYFGNLDAQHISFGRGFSSMKSSMPEGKIVRRPRSFSFQSIWEEAEGNVNYSSLWSDPVVLGVY